MTRTTIGVGLIALLASACVDAPQDPEPNAISMEAAGLSAANDESGPAVESQTSEEAGVLCDGGTCARSFASRTMTSFQTDSSAEPVMRNVRQQQLAADSAAVNKQRVLDHANSLVAQNRMDEELRFTLWLVEEPFDFSALRRTRGAARTQLVDQRRSSIAGSQQQVEALLAQVGGRIEGHRWLSNSLAVAVPARAVASVVTDARVFGAYEHGEVVADATGDGVERLAALVETGAVPGQDGGAGGNAGGPILVAQVEPSVVGGVEDRIAKLHNGFKVASSRLRRVWYQMDCSSASCTTNGTQPTTSTHGTEVASVLLGSIMGGQEPAYVTTEDRRRRSGLATDSRLMYLRSSTSDSSGLDAAIEYAVAEDADIINMSWGVFSICSDLCRVGYNPSNISTSLYNASAAGVILVKSAGNAEGNPTYCTTGWAGWGCTVSYPGYHPDVISVSALFSTYDDGFPPVDTFEHQPIAQYSGRGYFGLADMSGTVVDGPVVGLTTFGSIGLSYGAASIYNTVEVHGTSYAAAQVSSLAALFREWFSGFDPVLAQDAWFNQINLLLMGDGKRNQIPGQLSDTRVSGDFGFGFPRFFIPTSTYLGAGGGWGARTDIIQTGQLKSWTVGDSGPESSSVTGWKMVLAVDGDYNPPRLTVSVTDTCAGNITIKTAVHQGNKYRLLLDNPNDIHGRCLQVNVAGTDVSGGPRRFYAADMFVTSPEYYHFNVEP